MGSVIGGELSLTSIRACFEAQRKENCHIRCGHATVIKIDFGRAAEIENRMGLSCFPGVPDGPQLLSRYKWTRFCYSSGFVHRRWAEGTVVRMATDRPPPRHLSTLLLASHCSTGGTTAVVATSRCPRTTPRALSSDLLKASVGPAPQGTQAVTPNRRVDFCDAIPERNCLAFAISAVSYFPLVMSG